MNTFATSAGLVANLAFGENGICHLLFDSHGTTLINLYNFVFREWWANLLTGNFECPTAIPSLYANQPFYSTERSALPSTNGNGLLNSRGTTPGDGDERAKHGRVATHGVGQENV